MTREELEQQCLVSHIIDEAADLWYFIDNGHLWAREDDGTRSRADSDWFRRMLELRLIETHWYVGSASLTKELDESEDELIMGYEG